MEFRENKDQRDLIILEYYLGGGIESKKLLSMDGSDYQIKER